MYRKRILVVFNRREKLMNEITRAKQCTEKGQCSIVEKRDEGTNEMLVKTVRRSSLYVMSMVEIEYTLVPGFERDERVASAG